MATDEWHAADRVAISMTWHAAFNLKLLPKALFANSLKLALSSETPTATDGRLTKSELSWVIERSVAAA